MDARTPPSSPANSGSFPPTRWSLVTRSQSAGQEVAAVALEELCQRYWYPIFAYLRRMGHNAADAEDRAQGFFVQLLSRDSFQRAQRERGRLRSFLIGALGKFVTDIKRHDLTVKRGGRQRIVSIDERQADDRYIHEPRDGSDPALLFERAWARDVIERARAATRASYVERGKEEVFDKLRRFLDWNESRVDFPALAEQLSTPAGTLRVSVFRLRKRFRGFLEAEIAETVESAAELADEIAYLMRVAAD